jgi:hypothetical protein
MLEDTIVYGPFADVRKQPYDRFSEDIQKAQEVCDEIEYRSRIELDKLRIEVGNF